MLREIDCESTMEMMSGGPLVSQTSLGNLS